MTEVLRRTKEDKIYILSLEKTPSGKDELYLTLMQSQKHGDLLLCKLRVSFIKEFKDKFTFYYVLDTKIAKEVIEEYSKISMNRIKEKFKFKEVKNGKNN